MHGGSSRRLHARPGTNSDVPLRHNTGATAHYRSGGGQAPVQKCAPPKLSSAATHAPRRLVDAGTTISRPPMSAPHSSDAPMSRCTTGPTPLQTRRFGAAKTTTTRLPQSHSPRLRRSPRRSPRRGPRRQRRADTGRSRTRRAALLPHCPDLQPLLPRPHRRTKSHVKGALIRLFSRRQEGRSPLAHSTDSSRT